MPRGLGFFPDPVVIRSNPAVEPARIYGDGDDGEYGESSYNTIYPAARLPLQGPDTWEMWKDWNTNPSGHGGRRGPPVFVKALGYDLDASEIDVAVLAAEPVVKKEEKEDTMSGAGVSDWYRSLLGDRSKQSTSTSTPTDRKATTVTAPAVGSFTAERTAETSSRRPESGHRDSSQWFIRRALANKSSTPSRSPTPSSIAALVNVGAADRPPPPPRFHYALGPDNVGYARLRALGWGGGGLGRPAHWEGDVFERPSRGVSRRNSGKGTSRSREESLGVAEDPVDLTADSDDEQSENEGHGPGRTAPIATALKLDRRGLGSVSGQKKVTHSVKEIERAQRRGRGVKRPDRPEEIAVKQKIKWGERDRRERESRARIAAVLNS